MGDVREVVTTVAALFGALPGLPDGVRCVESFDGFSRWCEVTLTWRDDGRRRAEPYVLGSTIDLDWPDGTQRTFIVTGIAAGDEWRVDLIQTGAPRPTPERK